jgi:hypothetical protein
MDRDSILDVRKHLEYLEMRNMRNNGGLEDFLQSLADDEDDQSRAEAVAVDFPPLEFPNLPRLAQMFSSLVETQTGRSIIVQLVLGERYVERLSEMFDMAEDMEMQAEIQNIFSIMKSIGTSLALFPRN